MIQFRFDMPLWLMGLYGGVMVLVVLAVRFLLGRRLPKRMMPVLWALVLVRLLVPFSVSSPLSLPVPSFLTNLGYRVEQEVTTAISGVTFYSGLSSGSAPSAAYPDYPFAFSVDDKDSNIPMVQQAAAVSEDRILIGDWNFMPGNSLLAELGMGGWGDMASPSLLGRVGMSGPWMVGSIVLALIFFWRYIWSRNHFNGLYRLEENTIVRDTLVKCRVDTEVYSCDTIHSPAVVGMFRPIILLPASLDFSDRALLSHILTHEAMHIRRRDNLVKLIMMAALCLHWFNPLVWLMTRELCRDMEAACDEAVLAKLGQEESAPYAESLLRMAVPGLSAGLFASAFSRTEVERRVKGVLAYRKLGAMTLAAAIVVVLTSATAFATCGQTFFDNYLSDWCYSGNTYVARAVLNRPIALGGSRDYARSRANAVMMETLRDSAPDDVRVANLEKDLQKRLAGEFGVEPGAFRVIIAPALNPEETAAQYKAEGLEKDEKGRWTKDGKLVHVLEDVMAGNYYSNSEGEVDVYVIRDEQYKLLRIESYLYFRF